MSNHERKRWRRPAAWLAGMATLAWALTGCGGFRAPDDSKGTARIDIRPLVAQMNDQPAGSGYSAQSVSGPGNTSTTTDVKSVIIGAIVIAFQDTPIGPDTPITRPMQDNLTTAAENSIAFIKIVQLPSSDPFIDIDVPPPAATHWQVVAVGTRDHVDVLDEVSDNSPIYYGFNVDPSGQPFFLSGAAVTPDHPLTVTVVLQRACIANTPPAGCAQYKPERTAVVTDALEILSITVNGVAATPTNLAYPIVVRSATSPGVLASGACNTTAGCTPTYVAAQLGTAFVAGLSAAGTARIETTHMLSAGQPATCSTVNPAGGAAAVTALRSNCTSQFYSTSF